MPLNVNNNIGYSIVGSPTINDGVVSGFSNNDYLKMFQIDLSNPFEILFKVKTPSTWGTAYDVIFSTASTYGYTFQKNGPNKQFTYYVPDESDTSRTLHNGNIGLLEDTIYYIRTRFTGTQLIIDRSTDNKNWLIEYQENRTVGFFNNAEYTIGRNATAAQQAWSGSIYIADCYIKVNNYTIFNGKQQANIILGYIKVGNPTINDNIVSGFSNGNYIKTNVAPYLRQSKNLEIKTKFKVSSTSGIIFIANSFTIGLIINSDGKFGLYLSEGEEYSWNIAYNTKGTHVVSVNTDYYIKVIYDGTSYILKVSTDDITYVDDITIQSSKTLGGSPNSYALNFGVNYNGTSSFLDGSIDLNSTYVKANGRTWFDGKDYISSPINDVYLNKNVGYTIVGSPTIVNGVASGCDYDNYLNLSSLFPDSNNSNMDVFITLKSAGIGVGKGYRAVLAGLYGITIALTNSSTPTFSVRTKKSGESTYTTRSIYNYSVQVDSNNNFYLHFTKNGNVLSIQGANNDGVFKSASTYTLEEGEEIDSTSVYPEVMHGGAWGNIENSAIDLNNTYIKVNGITFFNGKETASSTVNEVYYNKNCGYTIVGSPTINDGIVSGFSKNDYLSLPANPSYNASDVFEWNIKFTTPAEFTTSWLLCIATSSIDCGIYYAANKNIFIPIASGSAYGEITSTNLQGNTTYIVNIVKQSDGNVVSTLKDANGQVIKQQTKNIGEVSLSYSTHKLGTSTSLAFSGSIDLNSTYIKVNGITWFNGKDVNFSNQNNYIINNGNLVWANPNIYLVNTNRNSYIEIPYYATGEDCIEAKTAITQSTGSVQGIVSSRTDSLVNTRSVSRVDSGVIRFDYNTSQSSFSNIAINEVFTFKQDKNSCYINNQYVGDVGSVSSFTAGQHLTLFNFSNKQQYGLLGKIYWCKISRNNELLYHFVPVPSGLVIGDLTCTSEGMFDIVNQQFYANASTGSFTFGKDGTNAVWTRSV